MLKTHFTQIVFSLAVIAALMFAIAPAPVYALSAAPTNTSAIGSVVNQVGAPVLPPSALVCRTVVFRHNGHLIFVRYCHRVDRST
jgi:hypothetical protein